MSEFGFLHFTFTGRNGTGTVSVPGVKDGDLVIWTAYERIPGTTPRLYGAPGAVWSFEITTDDTIDQLDGSDFSLGNGEILVFRGC